RRRLARQRHHRPARPRRGRGRDALGRQPTGARHRGQRRAAAVVTAPANIEVALNGTTPHAPRTPAEIAADALACIAAGATIVHNHNDEPMWVDDGVHAFEPYAEAWRPIIAAHPDVQLYTTQASGGPGIAI